MGICKTSENWKEICAAAKRFRKTVLLGIEYRLHGCAWVCTVSCEVTRFRKVDTDVLGYDIVWQKRRDNR